MSNKDYTYSTDSEEHLENIGEAVVIEQWDYITSQELDEQLLESYVELTSSQGILLGYKVRTPSKSFGNYDNSTKRLDDEVASCRESIIETKHHNGATDNNIDDLVWTAMAKERK